MEMAKTKAIVQDFVSYLTERETERKLEPPEAEAFQTMLASENVLQRDWGRPEEDIAWSDL